MTYGTTTDGPDVPTGGDEVLLPCGRDATDVWDAADAPADEHQRHCPHCGAVRAERAGLEDASTAFLSATEVASTPARLLGQVMRTVTDELRPGRPLPLRTDTGTASVTDVAVGNAVRSVLDGDASFVVRRFSAEAVGDEHAVRVWLSIAVSYEHFARHGDALARARVVAAIERLFDLRVESVEIDIVDVVSEPSDGRA
jgi:hypothetical protein